ncbi:MAG: DUF4912 domain-containing protein [Halanaerobiaceae bacterium]
MQNQEQDTEFSKELGPAPQDIKPESKTAKTPDKTTNYEWKENELKNKYDKTYIRLMVRDPGWLYTYWEINIQEYYENKPLLRIIMVDENQHFDQEISHEADEWYISRVKPQRLYKIKIGYEKQGVFYPLASSDLVKTPPNRPSDNLDQSWMYIEELSRYNYRIEVNSTLSIMKSIEDRKKRAEQNISSLQLQEDND